MGRIFGAVFCIVIGLNATAQTYCKGVVSEAGRSVKLNGVAVQNLSNHETALTDSSGAFSIKASSNNILVFSHPAYISDTLFLINLEPKRIYLTVNGIRLKEVEVTGEAFNPRREYPEAYTRGDWIKTPREGGITFSPSRLFGKAGKDARRLKGYLEQEITDRKIDAVFSKKLVSKFIPLKGKELEYFMVIYRPSLAFVERASSQDLVLYINDSYKKFKVLPPDKRNIPKLLED